MADTWSVAIDKESADFWKSFYKLTEGMDDETLGQLTILVLDHASQRFAFGMTAHERHPEIRSCGTKYNHIPHTEITKDGAYHCTGEAPDNV